MNGSVIPKTWQEVLISQIAKGGQFFDGDWVESKDQDPNGDVRLTQLADVGEGAFRHRSNRWLRTDQADALGVTYIEPGDLLIARMPDPMGRCCEVPNLNTRAVTVVDVAVVRVNKPDILPKFLMWAINAPRTRTTIESLASGTTRQRISRKNLGKVAVPIPPLPEQQRIVDILEEQFSRLDASLASIRMVRAKAARFRRSLLHNALHLGDLSDLPDGWIQTLMSEVAHVDSGRTPSKFESRLADNPRDGRHVPFYKVGDMNNSPMFMDDARVHFAPEEARGFGIEVLQPGTVVFPKAGGAIATNKKRVIRTPGAVDLNCMAVTAKDEMEPRLLYWFFESFNLSDLADGSVLPQIGKRKVQATPIAIPKDLQSQRLVVDEIESQVSKLTAGLAIADQLEARIAAERRSLLHAAFTGTLTAQWRETHNG